MQAEFKSAKGQAYTDMPGNFSGTLEIIINTKMKTNFDRAVFIASLNAVCRHLNLCEGTFIARMNSRKNVRQNGLTI